MYARIDRRTAETASPQDAVGAGGINEPHITHEGVVQIGGPTYVLSAENGADRAAFRGGGNYVICDRRAQRRYLPGRVVGVEKEIVFGNPEEYKISTPYVERNNLTLRMQIRRFTPLTNAFSRKPGNHAAAISLHASIS
jgi:hypothetical protein